MALGDGRALPVRKKEWEDIRKKRQWKWWKEVWRGGEKKDEKEND